MNDTAVVEGAISMTRMFTAVAVLFGIAFLIAIAAMFWNWLHE